MRKPYLKEFPLLLFLPRYWTTLSSMWIYEWPPILSRSPFGLTPGPKGCGMVDWKWWWAWKYLVWHGNTKFPLRDNGSKGSSLSVGNVSSKYLCTLAKPVSIWLNSSKSSPVSASVFACVVLQWMAVKFGYQIYHVEIICYTYQASLEAVLFQL